MNLRLQAERDLAITLQDGNRGFGLPVIIEDGINIIGNYVNNPFFAQVGRIHFFIDPDTGIGIDGNLAHIVIRISDIVAAGFNKESGKDWLITAPDIDGTPKSYKVRTFRPDNTLGVINCICEILDRDNSVNDAIIAAIMAELS